MIHGSPGSLVRMHAHASEDKFDSNFEDTNVIDFILEGAKSGHGICNWARAGVPSVYVCINPSGKPDGRSAEVLGIKGFGLQRDPPRFTTTWEDDAGALSAALSLSHGG